MLDQYTHREKNNNDVENKICKRATSGKEKKKH